MLMGKFLKLLLRKNNSVLIFQNIHGGKKKMGWDYKTKQIVFNNE